MTFGASQAITGFKDSPRFGASPTGLMNLHTFSLTDTRWSSHLKAATPVQTPLMAIGGVCTGCHDPHGVSATLQEGQSYGVPLLKGTWMTSPYPQDRPNPNGGDGNDHSWDYTYGAYSAYGTIAYNTTVSYTQEAELFAGLCLRCHPREKLTDTISKNSPWKSVDRVHETVKGWSTSPTHAYTCSKCHSPHMSNMPRLMVTNCLDVNHRGNLPAGGIPNQGGGDLDTGSYPAGQSNAQCHGSQTGTRNNQRWNGVTPW